MLTLLELLVSTPFHEYAEAEQQLARAFVYTLSEMRARRVLLVSTPFHEYVNTEHYTATIEKKYVYFPV